VLLFTILLGTTATTVLTLANLFKLRAGVVFTTIGNRVTNEFSYEGIDKSIQVACLAAVILDGWDKKKKEKYIIPSYSYHGLS